MNTPIWDFARRYAHNTPLRLHMPGHKGELGLGAEPLDITEIPGADSLYEASGIIAESEQNASTLFGCPTFYSTEGSSQCIRAMLSLAYKHATAQGRKPVIAVGRNAHKVFLSAAALLDFEIRWLYGDEKTYLSCTVTPQRLESTLKDSGVTAVYLTSPDYLGNVTDVAALSAVCRRHNALLLVDNAHGAYLKFLPSSRHPMDLGADLCCDSAHKTLPVLTGGAYLHVAEQHKPLIDQAKSSLSLFGSTSPSYLILQSLDRANALCEGEFPEQLHRAVPLINKLKDTFSAQGWELVGNEPLKLTIAPKSLGYTGQELSDLLAQKGIISEFADPDFLVLMFSPHNTAEACRRLSQRLTELPKKQPITTSPPPQSAHEQVYSPRQSIFAPAEQIPAKQSVGRILAAPTVGCPPAVPIVACGEKITAADRDAFAYYGIETLWVCVES